MLQRLLPKMLGKLHDTELLEYIGGTLAHPLRPQSVKRFEEFRRVHLEERERFSGDAEEYLILLVDHFIRTIDKFASLGEFTRKRRVDTKRATGEFVVPRYFSGTDMFMFRSIHEKLTHPESYALLLKPLTRGAEQLFKEVVENALIELQEFNGSPCAYFILILMQVHSALAEVIALHKYVPE